jgi:hypothetical protein
VGLHGRAGLDHRQRFGCLGRAEITPFEHLDPPADRGHRRAQLVRQRGQKLVLGAARLFVRPGNGRGRRRQLFEEPLDLVLPPSAAQRGLDRAHECGDPERPLEDEQLCPIAEQFGRARLFVLGASAEEHHRDLRPRLLRVEELAHRRAAVRLVERLGRDQERSGTPLPLAGKRRKTVERHHLAAYPAKHFRNQCRIVAARRAHEDTPAEQPSLRSWLRPVRHCHVHSLRPRFLRASRGKRVPPPKFPASGISTRRLC